MRKLLASALTAAALSAPAPAVAFDLPQAAVRLATVDSELTDCLQTRFLAAIILVRALRECIADERPDARELRKDLNGLISSLESDDPDRLEAIAMREALNRIRRFMNALDAVIKGSPVEIAQDDVPKTLDAPCRDSRIMEATALASPPEPLRLRTLCE